MWKAKVKYKGKVYEYLYPPRQENFRTRLAYDIHELLDMPLARKEKPSKGYKIIRAVQQAMTDALRRDEKVFVQGLGTFYVKHYEPRVYKNTRVCWIGPGRDTYLTTPEPMIIKPRSRVRFKPSVQVLAGLNWLSPNRRELRALKVWRKKSEGEANDN